MLNGSDVFSIYCPVDPIAQPRHRIAVIGGKARAFGAKSKHPIHAYKLALQTIIKEQAILYSPLPVIGPVELYLNFIMPRPKRMQWKRKPMPGIWHDKKPDVDNLTKSVMDALTGLAWKDDSQVSALTVEKSYADGDSTPGVFIRVTALDKKV